MGSSAIVEAEAKRRGSETSAGTSNDYMSGEEEGQTAENGGIGIREQGVRS
jgi:hypothetical protein